MKEELACDKLRRIATWLDYQDENFNEKMTSVEMIEKVFDACERHSLESFGRGKGGRGTRNFRLTHDVKRGGLDD